MNGGMVIGTKDDDWAPILAFARWRAREIVVDGHASR
jgi:hypothetical protein